MVVFKQMERQQTKFKEEKKRLEQKMDADAKAQQEQTTNMINASMPNAEQNHKVMMQENLDMINYLEEMQQRCNQELKRRISDLQKSQEQVKNEKKKVSKNDYIDIAIDIVVGLLALTLAEVLRQKKCIVM